MSGARTGAATVAVFLCDHLQTRWALPVEEIRRWAATAAPPVTLQVVRGLCEAPRGLQEHLARSGASRAVVGLCRRPASRADLQAAVRRAGLDPAGVEVVDLGTYAARAHRPPDAARTAVVLLAGAAARARAFAGSLAQQHVPVPPRTLSRRSLLTLSVLEYRYVPAVREDLCRAEEGCTLCEWACPHRALQVQDGSVALDALRCTGCGICVTACPHDAVHLPGWMAHEVHALADALADASASSRPAVLVLCAHADSPLHDLVHRRGGYPAPWIPLEVPCVEMVSGGWLLALVSRGVAVGVLPCPDRAVPGERSLVRGRVEFCRALLEQTGHHPEAVRLLPQDPAALAEALEVRPEVRPPRSSPREPFSHLATGQTILHLVGGAAPDVTHPFSPLGVVEVEDGCTLCGACATACPTDALAVHAAEDQLSLTFDPDRCVACGHCVPVCPEPGVLRLRQTTSPAALAAGKVPVATDRAPRCARCHRPIAPAGMLRRIAAALASHPETVQVISRYCADCRGLPGAVDGPVEA
ncbi:MAG: 4Fe-4S binding protein [Armatimonadota bacterium]|nr:4Fe-4S binding protein [Armatimonadota bacterium]MDR7403390.1 4Fe-4S binding protein [Armatimonadota bacterium]